MDVAGTTQSLLDWPVALPKLEAKERVGLIRTQVFLDWSGTKALHAGGRAAALCYLDPKLRFCMIGQLGGFGEDL